LGKAIGNLLADYFTAFVMTGAIYF